MNRKVASVMKAWARSRSRGSNLPVDDALVQHPLDQAVASAPGACGRSDAGFGRGAIDVEEMRIFAQKVPVGPGPGLDQAFELVVGRVGGIGDIGDAGPRPASAIGRRPRR